jgi:hypothetical protein
MINIRKLSRREALTGSVAAALVTAPGVSGGDGTANAARALQEEGFEEVSACASSFRPTFLSWLHAESHRFALPFSVGIEKPDDTKLYIEGLHPAISIQLREFEINVFVEWDGICWDQILWLYWNPIPVSGGGWIDESLLPEFQIVHPTCEGVWRAGAFDEFLTWINEALAQATHVAVWGSADECTFAKLVRGGKIIEGRGTIEESRVKPAHLLPVHGYAA